MNSLQLYKNLVKSIAKICSESALNSTNFIATVNTNPLVAYLRQEFRRHAATQELNCKAQNEAKFLAETYLYYLNCGQKHQALIDSYGGREKSVREAARLVGLEVPNGNGGHRPAS